MKPNMKLQEVLGMPEGIDWLEDNQYDYELTPLFWKYEYWFEEKEHIFVAKHPSKDIVYFENLDGELVIIPLQQALEIHKENYV